MGLLSVDQDVKDIIGTISPPPGGTNFTHPEEAIQKLLSSGLRLFITAAALIALVFLLWGAFDWITSGGDKDKISKAQNKITNAVIGLILIFVMLALFGVVAGDILGIVKKTPEGNWIFIIPHL